MRTARPATLKEPKCQSLATASSNSALLSLSRARLSGAVLDLPLAEIGDLDQAEAVQAKAVEDYNGSQVGYSLQGTSDATQKRLGCHAPIFGPLFDDEIMPDAARVHLPHGVLGVGCSFLFTLGRPYPADGEEVALPGVAEAVLACRPFLQVLGRRVPGSVPLNAQTATADFALDVSSVMGPPALNYEYRDLAAVQVVTRVDGNILASGRGADNPRPSARGGGVAGACAARSRTQVGGGRLGRHR